MESIAADLPGVVSKTSGFGCDFGGELPFGGRCRRLPHASLWLDDRSHEERERLAASDVRRRSGDPAVCATPNPRAFAKLRDLLMMHMEIRQKSVDTVGQAQTAAIEDYVIDGVRKCFPDVLGKWPPA
jgi:hypothetical protein